MQVCTQCNIRISTKTDRCPLCHKVLPPSDQTDLIRTYPDYQPQKRKYRGLIKAVSLAALILIALSVAVNVLTWSGKLWCIVLSACVLYAWLMGWFTCKRRIHLGLKLMGHALCISMLLMVVNAFAFNVETIHGITWAVSYAMPIVLTCFMAAISVMMIIKRQQLRDYLLYQFCLCAFVFIPLILALCGVTQPIQPSMAAAVFSCLTVISVAVLARRTVVSEFGRKFHI